MKKLIALIVGMLVILPLVLLSACSGGTTNFPSDFKVNLESQQNLKTEASAQRSISVTGLGEVLAVPDIASLRLGIVAQEKSVSEAQNKAAAAMDKVMAALTQAGVAKKDIQTQYFNITQLTKWDKEKEQQVVIGYQVSNAVNAKIRDLARVGSIIDSVAAAGGDLTRVDGISFSIDDPAPYQDQARDKAMANAKAKAKQLADQGGVTLGKPTQISESAVLPQPIPVFRGTMAAPASIAAPETSISPGEMRISITVSVNFAITG